MDWRDLVKLLKNSTRGFHNTIQIPDGSKDTKRTCEQESESIGAKKMNEKVDDGKSEHSADRTSMVWINCENGNKRNILDAEILRSRIVEDTVETKENWRYLETKYFLHSAVDYTDVFRKKMKMVKLMEDRTTCAANKCQHKDEVSMKWTTDVTKDFEEFKRRGQTIMDNSGIDVTTIRDDSVPQELLRTVTPELLDWLESDTPIDEFEGMEPLLLVEESNSDSDTETDGDQVSTGSRDNEMVGVKKTRIHGTDQSY